jgi:hypothetical protein
VSADERRGSRWEIVHSRPIDDSAKLWRSMGQPSTGRKASAAPAHEAVFVADFVAFSPAMGSNPLFRLGLR